MRNLQYRLAEETDLDAVFEVVQSAVAEMERRGIHQWDSLYPRREDFLEDIRKKTLYVGLLDGRIAVLFALSKECDEQYACGAWNDPGGEYRVIHRLCVDPAFQNRGVAKETLAHIENELRKRGVESIRLDVFCENPFALALYRGSGYEAVGAAHFRKGDFYLMEKRLNTENAQNKA